MRWSKKTCLLAVLAPLIVSVSMVSCTDQMADAVVDKFIDAMTGKKTTAKSDVDKPFSLKLVVSLGVFDSYTKKAVYPCEVDLSAEQVIGYRGEGWSGTLTTVHGDRFTTNKQTDSEGWVRTTFLFSRMYGGDTINLSYKSCYAPSGTINYIYGDTIKSAKQISKDSFELTVNQPIYVNARPPAK
jgi:hypothetical protein